MTRLTATSHQLLTEEHVQKLHSKNIHTVLNFVNADTKHLVSISKLSYKEILSIKNHLLNKNSAVIRNANDCYHELLLNSAIVSTGIKSVDNLLEGGLNTGSIYEICGEPSSGKTQLCLTIAKHVTQHLNQHVFYIDTKRDFSARKIKNILLENEPVGDIMEKILVSKINTLHELLSILYRIKDNFKDYNLRLIIVDSLPAILYQYSDLQLSYGLLNHAVNIMRVLATQYHVVFLVVNALTTWVKGNEHSQIVGCGKYWFNIPNVRLKIEKRLVDYEISLLKSTYLPNNKKTFVKIGSLGITDL